MATAVPLMAGADEVAIAQERWHFRIVRDRGCGHIYIFEACAQSMGRAASSTQCSEERTLKRWDISRLAFRQDRHIIMGRSNQVANGRALGLSHLPRGQLPLRPRMKDHFSSMIHDSPCTKCSFVALDNVLIDAKLFYCVVGSSFAQCVYRALEQSICGNQIALSERQAMPTWYHMIAPKHLGMNS